MTRPRNKLTARAVQAISAPGRHADGGGLYLSVDKNGGKRWVFLFTRAGRRREMGLGSALDVSLAAAREARDEAKRQTARGLDPIEERRSAVEAAAKIIPTFRECAASWLKAQPLTNEKYRKQLDARLTRLAAPLLRKAVSEISTKDVVSALKPHWTRIPETAERVLGQIEAVLDSAFVEGHIPEPWANPASWKGRVQYLLPRVPRATRHHRALPYQEVGAFMAALRQRQGAAAKALEFAVLTAARTSEVLYLTWGEIDLEGRCWVCPASRMKMKREHRVPLSAPALAVLESVRRPWDAGPKAYVFAVDRPLSNGAMERVLDRMGVEATVHGFRSTFRDWAGDCTDHGEAIVEAALAHSVGDETRRAYRRSDAFEKRRFLMDDWAAFCGRVAGENVLPLRTGLRV